LSGRAANFKKSEGEKPRAVRIVATQIQQNAEDSLAHSDSTWDFAVVWTFWLENQNRQSLKWCGERMVNCEQKAFSNEIRFYFKRSGDYISDVNGHF
jgi:hypothetical protein